MNNNSELEPTYSGILDNNSSFQVPITNTPLILNSTAEGIGIIQIDCELPLLNMNNNRESEPVGRDILYYNSPFQEAVPGTPLIVRNDAESINITQIGCESPQVIMNNNHSPFRVPANNTPLIIGNTTERINIAQVDCESSMLNNNQVGCISSLLTMNNSQVGYESPLSTMNNSQVGYESPQLTMNNSQVGYESSLSTMNNSQVGYESPLSIMNNSQVGYESPQLTMNNNRESTCSTGRDILDNNPPF